jgi:predicted nucleotidyltransferase
VPEKALNSAALAFPAKTCQFGGASMTLLQKRDLTRRRRRLKALADTRRDLRSALARLIPGSRVVLFGSLTKPGVFNDCSDVDLALESEPAGMSRYQLTGRLAEEIGRPVDVVLLSECRFRQKILREGETWTA